MRLERGQLYRVRRQGSEPRQSRVYMVVSRDEFLSVPYSSAICAPVYSSASRSEAQLAVGVEEGLKHPSYARCDELMSIQRSMLTDYVGSLAGHRFPELGRALALALDIRLDDFEPDDLS